MRLCGSQPLLAGAVLQHAAFGTGERMQARLDLSQCSGLAFGRPLRQQTGARQAKNGKNRNRQRKPVEGRLGMSDGVPLNTDLSAQVRQPNQSERGHCLPEAALAA